MIDLTHFKPNVVVLVMIFAYLEAVWLHRTLSLEAVRAKSLLLVTVIVRIAVGGFTGNLAGLIRAVAMFGVTGVALSNRWWMLFGGTLFNGAALVLNQGASTIYGLKGAGAAVWWLGDIVPLWPYGYYSIGDVIVALAVFRLLTSPTALLEGGPK